MMTMINALTSYAGRIVYKQTNPCLARACHHSIHHHFARLPSIPSIPPSSNSSPLLLLRPESHHPSPSTRSIILRKFKTATTGSSIHHRQQQDARSNPSIQAQAHDHDQAEDEKKPKIVKFELKKRIEPYLELSRVKTPIGSILLFLPCGSSLALAASSTTNPNLNIAMVEPSYLIYQTFLFGLGALIMRGAGCTINDLWDKSIDRKVLRTRLRPLASGKLTVSNAITWLGFQLSIGLIILLQLNTYSILSGIASLSLVLIYPLMKRITYWPQFVLGLAFNWGALLGSSAILGQTDWKVAIPLYLGHICWTIVYDTIYALQDKKSDLLVGVKSTALLFGPKPKPILAGFSGGFIIMNALSGFMNGSGWNFYTLAVLAPTIHLTYLLRNLNPNSVSNCHNSFKSSAITGSLVWLGCLLDYFIRFFQL